MAGLGALGPGDAGDAVGAARRPGGPPGRAEARGSGAPAELPRRDQLAAPQAPSPLEPAAHVTEHGERGDDDAGGGPEAQQRGVQELADHAPAQRQQRFVTGDGAEGHGVGPAVRVAHVLGPVGADAGVDEGLGERQHADGVPFVGRGGAPGLPARRAGGSDQGEGDGEAEHPPPGAQAPGGGAVAASGMAARAGHQAAVSMAPGRRPRGRLYIECAGSLARLALSTVAGAAGTPPETAAAIVRLDGEAGGVG